jgi:hypothetical protein
MQRAGFLVDDHWPEFDMFISARGDAHDLFCLPIDGIVWNCHRYAWKIREFPQIRTAAAQTLWRGFSDRRLIKQGAAQHLARLNATQALARRYARYLTDEVETVYVAQSLLPFVWREGHLGGRKFHVLMQRLPMSELHERLDRAAHRLPQAMTLTDFRAPPELVAAERAAFAAAESVVTPHGSVAALFDDRAAQLCWHRPPARKSWQKKNLRRIVFPAPTVARKGAHAVRDAVRLLGIEVIKPGPELEGQGFWDGIATLDAASADTREAAAIVLPAIIEDQPRLLLQAMADGMPVIASRSCGIPEQPGITLVPEDDTRALAGAIAQFL